MATYNVTLKRAWANTVASQQPNQSSQYANIHQEVEFSTASNVSTVFTMAKFFRFAALPSEYAGMRVKSVTVRIAVDGYTKNQGLRSGAPPGQYTFSYEGILGAKAVTSDWLENGITYNSQPSTSGLIASTAAYNSEFAISQMPTESMLNIIKYGVKVEINTTVYSFGKPAGSTATGWAYTNARVGPSSDAAALELVLEDNVPWADNLSPAFGPFDASGPNTLSWNFNAEAGISSTPKQKSCVVQWRGPDGVEHSIPGGPDSRLTIPGGIMPLKVPIEWRVKVTGTNNIESDWTEWIKLDPLDRTPVVLHPAPTSGYLDDSKPNDFTWELGTVWSRPSVMPKQQAFVFEWLDADDVVHRITGGATSAVTLPGGTLPFQKPFSWRVQIQSDDGLWSARTQWFNLTTVPIRSHAVAISPDAAILKNGDPITFVWQHASPVGQPQTGWEIQYRSDPAQAWVTIAASEGIDSAQQHIVTDYDMSAGVMYWRVRTTDATGLIGDWSPPLENYLRDKPLTPEVNQPPNEARPLVTWQATGQHTYQLQIMDMDGNVIYDSGYVATVSRQHQVTAFLASGTYRFAVKIKNEFGDESDWGERIATITLTDIGAPVIACAALYGAVRVILRAPVAGAYHIIYRQEGKGAVIPIAVLDEGKNTYDDYTCNGLCRYFARAVKSGSFGDSRAVTDAPDMRHTLVALASKPWDMVAVWYRKGQHPDRRETTRVEVNLRHFQGRALPVAEYGEGVDRERSFTFSIAWNKDPEGARRLMQMVEAAEPFIVRDQYGRKLFAALPSLQISTDRHSGDFTLTFNEVDYQEGIANA